MSKIVCRGCGFAHEGQCKVSVTFVGASTGIPCVDCKARDVILAAKNAEIERQHDTIDALTRRLDELEAPDAPKAYMQEHATFLRKRRNKLNA